MRDLSVIVRDEILWVKEEAVHFHRSAYPGRVVGQLALLVSLRGPRPLASSVIK
jgi:hypothetical protein